MSDRKSDFEDDGFETALHHEPSAARQFQRGMKISWPNGAIEVERRAIVGSMPGADVVIEEPTVSRLHAELELRDDGIWVKDLESTNGTFVGSVRIDRARVPDGAGVRLGAATITVTRTEERPATELWTGDSFGPLLGVSAPMRELFARLARVATTDATVLIHGETGSGKELVAQAIHEASRRAAGPLVIVDCATLPENLIETELFGHVKNAFTGAVAARTGAIEAAEGGTVFLDEVGELPLTMQPKLLRVIESKRVRRIGETNYRPVDVRFIAATHRDIAAMVNKGAFREDLYFRLAVVPVTLPPLRERRDDIPQLVRAFLPEGVALPGSFVEDISARPWRGNVRELRNLVERAVTLGTSEAYLPSPGAARGDLPAVPLDRPFKELRDAWMNHIEREYLAGLLAKLNGNISQVAATAGLDRTYVYRLMRKHDL
jgi:transcriptional regulator with GAF, ATPase, and Fis domain